MKRLTIYIVAFIVTAMLTGCHKKQPEGLLSKGKMEKVLYDYHLALAAAQLSTDSTEYRSHLYTEAALRKHGVTKAELDSSLVWYAANTRELYDIYKNIEIRMDKEIIGQIYMIGLPAFISTALISVSNTISFNLLSRYSDVEIAAFGVTKKLDMVPMSVSGGVSHGVLPLIAYNFAAGNYERMRKGMTWAAVFGLGFTCIYIICARLFNEQMVRFFIDSDVTVAVGAVFLSIECLCAPFMAISGLSNSTFQAMGKGLLSLGFASCQSAVIKIPMCLTLNHFLGVNGIIWANVATETIMVLIAVTAMTLVFRRLEQKK